MDVINDLRKRNYSSMTYDDYLVAFDKPPNKPILKPKDAPGNVEILQLDDGPRGPKLTKPILAMYEPDDVINEESDMDENRRAQSPAIRSPCFKAIVAHNIRVRSQSENLGFSVLKFLSQRQKDTK